MPTYALTVPNKNGSYDGDMVVKEYTSLTIAFGSTLTTDQPCRGLFIYVQGDCTINGSLSMTARGASANPTSPGSSDGTAVNIEGLRYGVLYPGGTDTLVMSGNLFNGCGTGVKSAIANQRSGSGVNYRIINVPRTGASATGSPNTTGARNDGNVGSSGQTGSGGSGQAADGGGVGGVGGAGTCFSGGAGGGGGRSSTGGAGSSTGGAGGGGSVSCGSCAAGGGAGNPGGSANGPAGAGGGGSGTGGLIWLVVGGNLTISTTGSITANGSVGGNSTNCGNFPNEQAAGGGSGGGSIVILHRGTLTNNGIIAAAGGAGGVACNGNRGGNGGAGSVQIFQIS